MVRYLLGSLLAVLLGFVLDLIFGDPLVSWHPIRVIGRLIAFLEKLIRRIFPKSEAGERAGGVVLALLLFLISLEAPVALLLAAYHIQFWLGVIVETVLCFFTLAVRSLRNHSMQVKKDLEQEGLEAGRKSVARIVGRDTDKLDEAGVERAAVETVAENFSDGIVAPLFYLLIGGAALGLAYKAVNTMDSMIGYRNETYRYFGCFAAHFDDVLNFIPARIAAWLLIASAPLSNLDGRNAIRIWRRDRRKHASPNAGQTEAAAAGALHLKLGGAASYFGKPVEKATIGDDDREVTTGDIARVNRLMMTGSVLALLLFVAVKIAVLAIILY